MNDSLWGYSKFAIEGENVQNIYDAVKESYYYVNFPGSLKIALRDGVLFIEEDWCDYPLFGDIVLPFLVGREYYFLSLWGEDGSWTTNDEEGKYFTKPEREESE